jgi:hypothetical protein
VLPSHVVQQLYKALIPTDSGIRHRIQHFFSALEEYAFLLNAEGRLGISDSGPYPLNMERILIVREFFDLKAAYYPWRELVADFPYPTCALAFTLDPADFHGIALTDRSAVLTDPIEYSEAIREITFVGSDSGAVHVLPFPEMDRLARMVKKVQPKLLDWFTRRSRREQIIHGALPWALRPFMSIARREEYPEALDQRALQLLPAYEDDDAKAVRWATHRCLAPGVQNAFVPLG